MNWSFSVATPRGTEIQSTTRATAPSPCASNPMCSRMIAFGRSAGATALRSIHTSSVDPPPMSTISNCSVETLTKGAQEITASRASSSGAMISSASPVSRRTWRMKSLALRARRQASVATKRIRRTPCLSSLRSQMRKAWIVRPIDARDNRPVASSPAPSCTVFEKLSTIVN